MKKHLAFFALFMSIQGSVHAFDFSWPISELSSPEAKMDYELREMRKAGTLPNLDESTTVSGTDANGNGVRDDIEGFITKTYIDQAERRAVMQVARAKQRGILGPYNGENATYMYAAKCLFSVFKDANPFIISRQIEAMTMNTKQRRIAYRAYNARGDGGPSLPSGNTCE